MVDVHFIDGFIAGVGSVIVLSVIALSIYCFWSSPKHSGEEDKQGLIINDDNNRDYGTIQI